MGKENMAVNRLLERKEIFADLINGTYYKGRQVVKPEGLELMSGQSGVISKSENEKGKAVERRGDIRMRADFGDYSVIFSDENQQRIHYAMPVRNMLYDALEYTKQVHDLEKRHKEAGERLRGDAFLSGITREDRLIPVITLVVYFRGKWDGCRSLHEMIDMEGKEMKELKQYLPDYKINVADTESLQDMEVFQSSLRHLFSMAKFNKDKKKLYQYVKEHQRELNQLDNVEMTAVLTVLGEQKRLIKMLEREDKEEVSMCKAIDDLIEDGRKEGHREGHRSGIVEGRINVYQELGYSREEVLKYLQDKFKLTVEEAVGELNRYWK